jgi:hypothetical protein
MENETAQELRVIKKRHPCLSMWKYLPLILLGLTKLKISR